MKKRSVIVSLASFLVVLTVICLVFAKSGNREPSSVTKSNIEALAGCEIVGYIEGGWDVMKITHCHWICYPGGTDDCPF